MKSTTIKLTITSIQYVHICTANKSENDNTLICLRISMRVEARAKRYFYSHNQSHLFDVYTFFTYQMLFFVCCLPCKWAEHKMRKKNKMMNKKRACDCLLFAVLTCDTCYVNPPMGGLEASKLSHDSSLYLIDCHSSLLIIPYSICFIFGIARNKKKQQSNDLNEANVINIWFVSAFEWKSYTIIISKCGVCKL